MNRIDTTFERLRGEGRKAFVAYITAGDPSLARTPELVFALERAGADIIELGVPFSDPLADGLVNQLAAQRALDAGATPAGVLDAVREIRKQSQVPIVLYLYYNLIARHGIGPYFKELEEAGVDGVLMLDLPPEESVSEHEEEGCANVRRIRLIAPTSPEERVEKICRMGSGFIYYVSREGVTGMQTKVADTIGEKLAVIRQHTELPVCVGFGVSNPGQAATVARFGDGVIVGSALVKCVAEGGDSDETATQLEALARPLAEAVHGA